MIISKAATRYAKAFFDIAQEKSALEAVNNDFEAIGAAIEKSGEFSDLLKAPLISSEKRVAALKALFEKKADKTTFEFLMFLEKKGRLDILADVIYEFAKLNDRLNNVERISITSAFPMADAQVSAIKERLQQKLSKSIVAEVKVEPGLIGGFKVKVGDQVYDLSVVTQLEKIKQSVVKA
ncbi:MAG: ATP synthase F1 subunit delta [Lentisphaerales bacterium]|nr:ATP synthase F1 subunit delta [Lentisphaerales bacterium]